MGRGKERRRGGGREWWMSPLSNQAAGLHALTKQPACLPSPSPLLPPERFSPLWLSFLFVWLKTWPFTPRQRVGREGEGRGGEESEKEGKRVRGEDRRKGGWGGETALSKLGLIYFINRDYKFNLQTRGQNFSLTRGPWRTRGLGDQSYYWLHISICLWCSMSAFLPLFSSPIFWQRGWF